MASNGPAKSILTLTFYAFNVIYITVYIFCACLLAVAVLFLLNQNQKKCQWNAASINHWILVQHFTHDVIYFIVFIQPLTMRTMCLFAESDFVFCFAYGCRRSSGVSEFSQYTFLLSSDLYIYHKEWSKNAVNVLLTCAISTSSPNSNINKLLAKLCRKIIS